MNKNKEHTQCLLRKGNTEQISWIPSKFAKVGRILRLKDDDGWEVISAGHSMDSKFINERSRDHKNMRKMTDI